MTCVDRKKQSYALPIKYTYHYILHYLKFNKKRTKLDFKKFSIELTHLLHSVLRLKIPYFITHPHENCIFQTNEGCLIIHFISFGWTSFYTFTPRDTITKSFSLSSFNIPLTLHSVIRRCLQERERERDSNWEFDLYCFIVSFLDCSNMSETVCDVNFE